MDECGHVFVLDIREPVKIVVCRRRGLSFQEYTQIMIVRLFVQGIRPGETCDRECLQNHELAGDRGEARGTGRHRVVGRSCGDSDTVPKRCFEQERRASLEFQEALKAGSDRMTLLVA